MAEATQAETEGTETPTGEAAEPTEATAPVEGEAVAGGSEEPTPAETPEAKKEEVEGEEKPVAEEAKPAEIPEEVLQKAAVKFANKTMAAARRAQREVETVKSENTTLKRELEAHRGFYETFRSNPREAIRLGGYTSTKAFLDDLIASDGGEEKTATADDRVAALEKQLKEREDREAQAKAQAAIEQAKTAVFTAIEGLPDRYDLAATDIGKSMLWEAIETYHSIHGDVPDEAVYLLADNVEKALETNVSKARKFSGARSAETKTNAPAAAQAAPAARTGGKTLTNKSTAGAPTLTELPMDPDERRAYVNRQMREAGELTD